MEITKVKRFLKGICFLATSIFLFAACHHAPIPITFKLSPTDPFKATIVPSQYVGIDSKKDNVVEGDKGTVVVFPKGCFRNSKGDIVEDSVKVELSEALSPADMLLSNLTTTSNGAPLETDGMIYINATAKGEQLSIDKNNPIHIEIPTTNKRPGMMAYRGVRDSLGNMNWVDPQKIDNYLVPVDITELDFLPDGFKAEVEKGLPFRGHKVTTKELVDSLYYSLSYSDGSSLIQGLQSTNYNEPYYNKNKKIVNGKYTSGSYVVSGPDTMRHPKDTSASNKKGIDPAIIKVLRSGKFQNTLIATREFQTRLKAMFKTCNNAVLEIYIKNLDKNMYELDSMAAEMLKGTDSYDDFIKFKQQRLTNVKNADKNAALLKGYYEEQMKKVTADLKKIQEKASKKLVKTTEEFVKVANDYQKVLLKRETYRMESYGFNWTNTGWVNIDTGTRPKEWGLHNLEVVVGNGKQFDRVYTYVIYESIKSLYRLNSTDKENFYVGNDEQKQMLMPNNKPAVCVAIGYKGDVPYLAIKEFETVAQTKLSLTLVQSTLDEVKQAIKPFDKYSKENRISDDLVYMYSMYNEDVRQKELQKESEFIHKLWNVAHPCCKYLSLLNGHWKLDSARNIRQDFDEQDPWSTNLDRLGDVLWSFSNGTGGWEYSGYASSGGTSTTNEFTYYLSDLPADGMLGEDTLNGASNKSGNACGNWLNLAFKNNGLRGYIISYEIKDISENRIEVSFYGGKYEEYWIFHKYTPDTYK